MELSNRSEVNNIQKAKNEIINISAEINEKLPLLKTAMTKEQVKSANDALAIAETLKSNLEKLSDEDFERSASKFVKLVQAAFSEDVSPLWLREKIKLSQEKFVKPVTPRGLGEGAVVGDFYRDAPSDSSGYTRSAIDHSRIAERIMQDLNSRKYVSAQDAYDGYCAGRQGWPYASSRQKLELAELLRAYGFIIDAAKWEKAYEEEYKEFEKLHGKDGFKSEAIKRKQDGSRESNEFCNKCNKTHKFEQKKVGGKWVSKDCSSEGIKKKGQIHEVGMPEDMPGLDLQIDTAPMDMGPDMPLSIMDTPEFTAEDFPADVKAKALELIGDSDKLAIDCAKELGKEFDHVRNLDWFIDKVCEKLMPSGEVDEDIEEPKSEPKEEPKSEPKEEPKSEEKSEEKPEPKEDKESDKDDKEEGKEKDAVEHSHELDATEPNPEADSELGKQGQMEEDSEPDEDGIYISYTGPLGSQYSVGAEGRHLGTFNSWDEVVEAINNYMDQNQYYPNVYKVSDHGNIELLDFSQYRKGQLYPDQREQLTNPGSNDDMINQMPETVQNGMNYKCSCGYAQNMEKEGMYNCPKCGGMMKYSDDMAMPQPNGSGAMPEQMGGVDGQPKEYDGRGTQYLAVLRSSANRNDWIDIETVAKVCQSCAEEMKKSGMTRIKAKYFLEKVLPKRI